MIDIQSLAPSSPNRAVNQNQCELVIGARYQSSVASVLWMETQFGEIVLLLDKEFLTSMLLSRLVNEYFFHTCGIFYWFMPMDNEAIPLWKSEDM